MNRAYLESDSMMPEHRRPIAVDLQLSVNRALMDRLDALEKRIKELEYRQSV